MSGSIGVAIDGGVATITLDNPGRLNALSGSMLDRLAEAVDRVAADDAIGAVVLAGAGEAFSAGGDVKGMAERAPPDADGLEPRIRALRRRMEVVRRIHDLPKPVIARLRGAVAGAGLSVALAADLRVAGDRLKLTTAFARVGLSGDFGGSWFLTRLVGPAKAKELYWTSPVLGADEALALGLVNRVVADAALDGAVADLARRLAEGPRVALGYMKQTIDASVTLGLSEALDLEAARHARTGMTEDHREAAQAFVAKRTPVFRGR